MRLYKASKLFFVLAVLIIISSATVWLLNRPAAGTEKIRNVILISIDTWRADHVGCYGCKLPVTPNIDQFAKESVLFENVVTAAPITLPSHSTMLTGTLPPYHGVHNNLFYRLAESNLTLPEILEPNGFTSAAFVSAFVLDSKFGLNQGFAEYHDEFENVQESDFGNERRADETTGLAVKWLEENQDEKFFMFLHYFDPHDEYNPPEPFASRFADKPYAGEIAYADYHVGIVLEKLKQLGLYDSSLIIVVGDHGEMLGEHGEETHMYFIYESAIKVPMIFKVPGLTKPKRVSDIAGLVDIVPTVCSLLKIQTPLQVEGRDLSPYFYKKRTADEDRYLYCESIVPQSFKANSLLAVVTNNWKYIQTTRPELYDLIEDPCEITNLAKLQPQRCRIMQDKLREILEKCIRKSSDDAKVDLDPETIARLESIGYVGTKIDENWEFDQDSPDPKDFIGLSNAIKKCKRFIYKKQYDQAKKLCEETLQIYPGSSELHNLLAKVASNQGRWGDAISHLKKSIALAPEFPDTYDELGNIMALLGKWADAALCFKTALKLNPDIAETNLKLAKVLIEQQKFNEAIFCYQQSLKLNPVQADVHNGLASIYTRQKQFDLAVKHLQESLRIKPEQPAMLENLARIYSYQGKNKQAIEYWEKALQYNPNQPQILNSLAWIKAISSDADLRDEKKALQLARQACELTNFQDAYMMDTLAAALAATGNFGEATDKARKAIELANAANNKKLAAEIEERLGLYEAGKPYQSTKPTTEEKK